MRRPGEERGAGTRGRERRRYRGGARVTWDVIRGPQDLLLGRRGPCEQRGDGGYEQGAEEEEDEARDLQEEVVSDERSPRSSERGSMETISAYIVRSGSQQEEKASQGLSRSCTSEERYWGEGSDQVASLEGGSRDQDPHDMTRDCRLGEIAPRREDLDPPPEALQCGSHTIEVKDHRAECHGTDQEEAEKSHLDVQVFQKRQRKSKGGKEKKRSKANGACRDHSQPDGDHRMEESSFQELYRGLSVEEEDSQPDAGGGEGSPCVLGRCKPEATYRLPEKELRQGDVGTWSKGCDCQGSREALFSPKDKNGLLEVMKSHRDELEGKSDYGGSSECYSCYRSEFRSPGNGSSGSGEGAEMEQGNYHGTCREVTYDLGKYERVSNCEMEDKNFNPLSNQHIESETWVCSSPSHAKPLHVEDSRKLEEVGTWCWCLHLYLGDTEATAHDENDEKRSKDSGYSLNSTLRVGEGSDEPHRRDRDIPEPLTKKGGRVVDTPELQEWVNWWQGWAGSCRAVPGHRRGAKTQILGCRGEARAEQKQQDVWVLREWTRRGSGRRGGGQRISGGDVWVLRNQEEGKQGSAWQLDEEDVWVPREPRKQKGAYFVTDNAKWGPHSAKPGVSDKGEL